MIDAAVSAAFERIAARENDVRHAFAPDFVPANDVATVARSMPAANPLSVAAPDGAYFVTAGDGGTPRFSRDGSFALAGNELRSPDGAVVLGFTPDGARSLAPLRVDPYDVALGRVVAPRIGSDGTFAYERSAIDPRTGQRRTERIVAGRIALARFPAATQAIAHDAAHVVPPAGVAPAIGRPGDPAFGPLRTFARDTGRVDLLTSLEKMRDAYRSFEALRSANDARGAVDKTAMDLLK